MNDMSIKIIKLNLFLIYNRIYKLSWDDIPTNL